MEELYNSNFQRSPNFNGIINNMSPYQARSPRFDPYACNSLHITDSALIRYLRSASPSPLMDGLSSPVMEAAISRTMQKNKYSSNSTSKSMSFGSRRSSPLSPLSAIENLDKLSPSRLMTPPGYSRPAKGDEEVLVMDGISIGNMSGARTKLAVESGGSSSASSSSPGNGFFKAEMCRSWEDSGSCRFGYNCQFAHGKEEMRPTHFPIKNKSEVQQLCRPYANTGVCTYGPKCKFFHPSTLSVESAAAISNTASPIKLEQYSRGSISIIGRDWTPQDDGIDVTLPSSILKLPARDDFDANIQVLYGPTTRRRLQVFTEICPDFNQISHG